MTSLVDAPEAIAARPPQVAADLTDDSGRARLNGLDGFRALAVTVVVLYHFRVAGFSGGWIGPELFFVLSGYLITTLLLDRSSSGTGRLSITEFWIRRVRRLYPALLLLVATVVPVVAVLAALRNVSVALLAPGSLSSESFATLAYYANWHLIAEKVGYFGQSTSLFKHTWSLAIEEQFYLVFPLIFVLVRRAGAHWRSLALGFVGAGAAVSAVDAALSTNPSTLNSVYYSTQTNAYHLLIGVGLAFASYGWHPAPGTVRRLRLLSVPALAIVVAFVEVASDPTGMPRLWVLKGGGVVLDLAAAALLLSLVYGDHASLLSRSFNLRPIVWLGSISYGVYLWHYPIAVLITPGGTHLPPLVVVVVQVALTLVAASLSYFCVEVVVRQSLIEPRRLRWTVYAVGAAGAIALVTLAPQLVKPY